VSAFVHDRPYQKLSKFGTGSPVRRKLLGQILESRAPGALISVGVSEAA
jgi:hypothetical protein